MFESPSRLPLYVPAFGRIYETFRPYSYPVLRFTYGAMFVPHGAQKLFGLFGGRPIAVYQESFARMGSFWNHPGWVYYIGSIEFFGGLLVALGLFTRFAATQLFLFMAMATFVGNAPRGWFWTVGGSEAPATWGIVLWFIMIHGSGAFSLDKRIGKEI